MKNKLLYVQGYDNLIKELQTNEELKTNIKIMIDNKSPLYSFYDGDKYIKLRFEEVDVEEDEFDDNIHVLNGNGIEFIDGNQIGDDILNDKYYTCKNCEAMINGVEFNNINWYKIVKKEDKLYLEINNEVLTKEQYECLLKIIRKHYYFRDNLFYIRLIHALISDDGSKTNKVLTYTCRIPDGEIIKILNGEVSNLMLKFEIVSIRG